MNFQEALKFLQAGKKIKRKTHYRSIGLIDKKDRSGEKRWIAFNKYGVDMGDRVRMKYEDVIAEDWEVVEELVND